MLKQLAKRIEAHGVEDNLSLGRLIAPDEGAVGQPHRVGPTNMGWEFRYERHIDCKISKATFAG